MALIKERKFRDYLYGTRDLHPLVVKYQMVIAMPPGAARRRELMDLFRKGYQPYCNSRGCVLTYRDPDIKYLLKKERIEMCNERKFVAFSSTKRNKSTFLSIKK